MVYTGAGYLLGFEVSSPVLGRVDENQTQHHYSFARLLHQCSHMKRQQHYSRQQLLVWYHLVNLETKNIKIKSQIDFCAHKVVINTSVGEGKDKNLKNDTLRQEYSN